jgi:hypothetical protein
MATLRYSFEYSSWTPQSYTPPIYMATIIIGRQLVDSTSLLSSDIYSLRDIYWHELGERYQVHAGCSLAGLVYAHWLAGSWLRMLVPSDPG